MQLLTRISPHKHEIKDISTKCCTTETNQNDLADRWSTSNEVNEKSKFKQLEHLRLRKTRATVAIYFSNVK